MKNKVEKFRIGKIFLFVISLALVFAFCGTALAGNVVTNISGDGEIFNADNIYPGYTEEHTVTIQNTSSDPSEAVDVYLNFDVTNGSRLADKLRLYVIRNSDDKYRIGGTGDRMSLDEADDNSPLYLDRLSAGQSREYKIKLRFSSDVDNTYQNEETEFDIDFRLTGETASGAEPLRPGYVTGGGAAPAEEVQGVNIDNGELQTVEGQEAGDLGVAAGATKDCQSWPRWAWILALIIFTLNFGRNAWKNWEDEKYKWIFPLAWTVLAVVFWYFFDKCREFQWFLQASIIIAIVLHFSYLYYLRKKISQVEVKTEIE